MTITYGRFGMRARGVCHRRIVRGRVPATILAGVLAMQVAMVVGAGSATNAFFDAVQILAKLALD